LRSRELIRRNCLEFLLFSTVRSLVYIKNPNMRAKSHPIDVLKVTSLKFYQKIFFGACTAIYIISKGVISRSD